MGNREVNYPDILPQEQLHTYLSLSCSSRVNIDVNVYNNTTRKDINSWKVIQASSAHLTNIFEMTITQWSISLWYLRAKFENVIMGLFSNCRKDTLAKFSAMV